MKHPKTILITGASSGIGKALAVQYAAPGVVLLLVGRNLNNLDSVAGACRDAGAKVYTQSVDVRSAGELSAWITLQDVENPIDLVIANAGVTSGTSVAHPVEPAEATRIVVSSNLIGVINTVAPCVAPMRARRRGQFALMGSLAGMRGLAYSPGYCASKAGIRAYAQALRSGLRKYGIEVNLISPGFVDTPLDNSIASPKPFKMSAERASRIIRKGLARNRAQIAFPLPLYLGIKFLNLLPNVMADWLLELKPVDVPLASECETARSTGNNVRPSGEPLA